MRARDVMSTPVTTIATDATLLEAAKLLVNTRISALPVVDGRGAMVGIVSEIDLIGRVLGSVDDPARPQVHFDDPAAHEALSGKVADVMSHQVISASEDATLEEIAALLLKHRAKRIPIVRDGSVVGVVSRIDLVKSLLSHAAPDSAKATPQPARDDETMRREVMLAVHRLGIRLGGTFDVVVRHGISHLWGRVASEEEEQACQMASSKVPGVIDTISHMQILPRY